MGKENVLCVCVCVWKRFEDHQNKSMLHNSNFGTPNSIYQT